MKRSRVLVGVVLGLGIVAGLVGSQALTAQDPLTSGTILGRTDVPGDAGMEAILVLRELPAGAESGRLVARGTVIYRIVT